MIIYTVQRGDSIFSIAQKFGVTTQQIISDNALAGIGSLPLGLGLFIRAQSVIHTVLPGESIYSIANVYNLSAAEIERSNPQIINPQQLYPGQKIRIEARSIDYGRVNLNGYGVVPVNSSVLESTLPYLTFLSVFDYKFTAEGDIRQLGSNALNAQARQNNAAPLMVITNIANKGFDSDIMSAILNSPQTQQRFINNILTVLDEENFYGLNVDIEYVYQSERELYNNFLSRLSQQLQSRGYYISSALAPKISDNQKGILYESHDYAFNGEVMDSVTLMTYEWGYTFSAPSAVAPINQVRRVLEYGVTKIPRRKIFMGVPNYGYDWTLPYTPGTAAKAVTVVAAINTASRFGAEIKYDELAQTPYFYYTNQNVQHVIWFEDARSVYEKMSLISEFGLGGVSYWNINSFYPPMFLIPQQLYGIETVL